jgi:anti-sigma B factor antagonist
MALPACTITVGTDARTGYVRVAGRACAERARDFKLLARRLVDGGHPRLVLDLSQCVLMDSTFSGVLAGLADPRPGETPVDLTLVGANERVRDLLDNLGVLPLVHDLDPAQFPAVCGDLEELPAGPGAKEEIAGCCLEAHRVLMALKPENVAKFQTLERYLSAELEPHPAAAA